MSIEVEVLSEAYIIMKQYVSVKDRQELADNLMSVMVDLLSDTELKEFANADNFLSRALTEYSVDDHEDEDEGYED
jgi:hypothetical protein